MQNKRKLNKKFILIIGIILLSIGTYLWSTLVSPTSFELNHQTFIHSSIPEGFDNFKIAFFSDLDLQTEKDLDYLEKCIKKMNEAKCDMAIFGGDLFEGKQIFSEDRLVSILKSINVTQGKLAVLGENEIKGKTDQCIEILEKSGFEVLRNKAHYVYANEDRIVLAGLENSSQLDSLLSADMPQHFILSVIHQPDYFTEIQKSSSLLQLSGHSAGGIIQIPFMGGMIHFDGSKTYTSGTTTINNHTLMISNGIGLGHNQNFRFNANPNAIILTLKTSSQ